MCYNYDKTINIKLNIWDIFRLIEAVHGNDVLPEGSKFKHINFITSDLDLTITVDYSTEISTNAELKEIETIDLRGKITNG